MEKTSFFTFAGVFLLLTVGISSISHAQLREDINSSSALTGSVIKQNPSEGADWGNLFNMQMDHSYSMMFSSFGGQMQNMNAYTNTMRFFFSEDLTGRVDLSLLHSPFGNNFMSNNNGMDTQLLIRNAELNYQINDNSNISIHFQQVPQGYGFNPWGMGPRSYHSLNSGHLIFD